MNYSYLTQTVVSVDKCDHRPSNKTNSLIASLSLLTHLLSLSLSPALVCLFFRSLSRTFICLFFSHFELSRIARLSSRSTHSYARGKGKNQELLLLRRHRRLHDPNALNHSLING